MMRTNVASLRVASLAGPHGRNGGTLVQVYRYRPTVMPDHVGLRTGCDIYSHGGHAGGIRPRNGIPFGTWHQRFLEWATDLGMMKPGRPADPAAQPRP
jgi:hypothetical protein